MRPLIGPTSIRARRGGFVPSTAYTPSWTATSGTAPAIGNGTLTGSYVLRDGFYEVGIYLLGGTTTTWGNAGTWRFSAPATSSANASGAAWILDSGTAVYSGAVKIASASNSIQVAQDGAGLLTFNMPMTWATGDELILDLRFPA